MHKTLHGDITRNASAFAWAVGLIGLGALSIYYRDFALQWQPVPETWPARSQGAIASGLLLVAGGLLVLPRRSRALGAALLAVFVLAWVVALHGPLVWRQPGSVPAWLGFAESLAIAIGGYALWRDARPRTHGNPRATRWLLPMFGATLVVFGVSHFVYAEFTASMVPAWLPMRLPLAWLTGGIHAATGLLLIAGRLRRPAALLEAAMMTSFVLLVHLPRVFAQPSDRVELTMLCFATALASAAWLVATSSLIDAGRGGVARPVVR